MYYPHAEYLYLELTNDKIDTNGSQMIRLQGLFVQGYSGPWQNPDYKYKI